MPLPTYTVPETATYTDPSTGTPLQFQAGDVIPLETAIHFGLPGAAAPPDVTATADGTGTAEVPAGVPFLVVSSGDAAHLVTLPVPVVGRVLALKGGATGYALQTHDPEGTAINGGTGEGASSAVAADVLVVCLADSPTTWLCSATAADGTTTATAAAG